MVFVITSFFLILEKDFIETWRLCVCFFLSLLQRLIAAIQSVIQIGAEVSVMVYKLYTGFLN